MPNFGLVYEGLIATESITVKVEKEELTIPVDAILKVEVRLAESFSRADGTYQKFCVRGRVIKLMDRVCKTFAEQNGELVSGLLPGPLRHLPIFLDIAQGQEQ